MEPAWAWRVLGVPPGSPPADVRRAFRRAAQLLHPDRVTDLGDDVRAEAHRRMAELATAYKVCLDGAVEAPPHLDAPLRSAGAAAADLLAAARVALRTAAGWEEQRRAVTLLEQVADAWPGSAEGDAARVLLVTSAALSPRERAGHLVLVADETARDAAWDALSGRDELAVAQVVHAHPTADEALRRKARHRLAELDDWATLAADADPDVRRNARAHLLLRDAQALTERARWLERRERRAFETDLAGWRSAVAALTETSLAESLRDRLAAAESAIVTGLASCR